MPLLGDSLVRNLFSPDWKTRKGGLAVLGRHLDNAKWREQHGLGPAWRAATHVLDLAIK